MSRALGSAVPLALVALSLLPGSGSAAAPKTVNGAVGPGFTIGLEAGGKPLRNLRAGVPYRFVVGDRSSVHNFHLRGPGVNKVFTTILYTGTKSVVLRLEKGAYRFLCDPHASVMRGSFRVG